MHWTHAGDVCLQRGHRWCIPWWTRRQEICSPIALDWWWFSFYYGPLAALCWHNLLPQIREDEELPGQLCARCYEYCENWFAFKTTCWINDKGQIPIDPESEGSEDESYGPIYDEVTIESEDYGNHEFDGYVSCSPSLASADDRQSSSSTVALSKEDAVEQPNMAIQSDWKCIYCEKKHDTYRELRDHLVDQHINAKYPKCGSCNKKFSNTRGIIQHLLHQHTTLLVCPLCSGHLSSFTQFDKHMEEEHQQRGYGYLGAEADVDEDWDCPVCLKEFRQHTTLRSHLKEAHFSIEVLQIPAVLRPIL